MSTYQSALESLHAQIKQTHGEPRAKELYEKHKGAGIEVMSRELILLILGDLAPRERDEFFAAHSDLGLKRAFVSRAKRDGGK